MQYIACYEKYLYLHFANGNEAKGKNEIYMIRYYAAGYMNTKADPIENVDCLTKPLEEKGYTIDLNSKENKLLVLSLIQKGDNAELQMQINGNDFTFTAPCDASKSGQERFNIVINSNISHIVAEVENRMIQN